MKGILWKWTNYWMGWQPRWFILEDGLLSYYKSEEEVKQGCKGSLSLSACDITVHQTDNLRLDIVIPGEQHLYVRASSTLERQQWLVALGTAKAHGPESKARKTADSSMNQDIKTKKSELRLYGDLLMQQVLSIKEAAVVGDGGVPDTEKLDECTSLFSATCDTFIKTLEECVKLSNSMAINVQATSTQLPPVVPHISSSSGGTSNGSSSKIERDKIRTHSNSHFSIPEG